MNAGYNGIGFRKIEAGQKYHAAVNARLRATSQHPLSNGWKYIGDDDDGEALYRQGQYRMRRFRQFDAWGVHKDGDDDWLIFQGYTTQEVTAEVFGG